MGSKQVNFRVSEDEYEELARRAKASGVSVAEFAKTEALAVPGEAQREPSLPEPERGGALPGVRLVMVCVRCRRREMGDPAWVCPEHRASVRQANRPYMGESTEPSAAQIDAWAAETGRSRKDFDSPEDPLAALR